MNERIIEEGGYDIQTGGDGNGKSQESRGLFASPLEEISRLTQKLDALDLMEVKSEMMFLMKKLTESKDEKNITELKKLMDAFGAMSVNLHSLAEFIEKNFNLNN